MAAPAVVPARTASLAIVAAMRAELAPLLGREDALRRGHVELLVCGVGAQRADAAAARLFERVKPAALLVVGVGGGLQPGLPCGALVVAERLRDGGGELPAPDAQLVLRAVRAGAQPGTVLSAAHVLCTVADKARGRAASGTAGPAVVDLESAALARRANAAGVPYAIVRVVCDTAEEDLPLDFNACDDGDGGIDRWAVARRAILHPSLLPRLLELRQRVDRCAERLAEFSARFLAQGAA